MLCPSPIVKLNSGLSGVQPYSVRGAQVASIDTRQSRRLFFLLHIYSQTVILCVCRNNFNFYEYNFTDLYEPVKSRPRNYGWRASLKASLPDTRASHETALAATTAASQLPILFLLVYTLSRKKSKNHLVLFLKMNSSRLFIVDQKPFFIVTISLWF